MNKRILTTVALGISLLAGTSAAAACELGRVTFNAAGEQQLTVVDGNGRQLGMTLQGRDGRWEAIVDGRGALNQRFGSARLAAQAICSEAQP